MDNDKVVLARYRKGDYVVNDPTTRKRYFWAGSKGNMISKLSVPRETFDWLAMSTTCLSKSSLVVVEDKDKEELNYTTDLEQLTNNVHTREEIEKILTGNYKAMEKKLNEITNVDEKKFVLEVAKELKIDSSTKRAFIVKWAGIEGLSTDEIFSSEDE